MLQCFRQNAFNSKNIPDAGAGGEGESRPVEKR